MVRIGTGLGIGVGAILLFAVLYTFAGAADTLRSGNRRRDDGSFAPDRTTQLEQGLTVLGILAILLALLYVFGGVN